MSGRHVTRSGGRAVALAAMVLAFGSCKETYGPCEIEVVGHILELRKASDAATGAPISPVVLSNITSNGKVVQLQYMPVGRGASIDGNTLRCTPSCAFETIEGPKTFDVSASGYASKPFSVDAQWDYVKLGCPGKTSGPTVFEVALQKAP